MKIDQTMQVGTVKVTRRVVVGEVLSSGSCVLSGAPSPRPSPTGGEGGGGEKLVGEGVEGGPTLGKRVSNLTRDFGIVLDVMFAGKLPVEKRALVKAKLEVCAGCEFWRPFAVAKLLKRELPGWGVCAHEECGCWMGFKARLAGLECPVGKWENKVLSSE